MNYLSWLLYLADVSSALATFFGILGAIGIFFVVVITGFLQMCKADVEEKSNKNAEIRSTQKTILCFFIPFCLLTLLVSCILPSRQTMYYIAASEVGEDVVNSTTGGKALKALDSWLENQIKDNIEE